MSAILNRLPVVNDVLDGFRAGATQVGISPKALSAPIAAGITWAFNRIGLDFPDEIVFLISGSIAAYLLPPGRVAPRAPGAVHPEEVGIPSDKILVPPPEEHDIADAVATAVEATTAQVGQAAGRTGDVLETTGDVVGVAVTGVGQAAGAGTREVGGVLGRVFGRRRKP